MSHHGQRDECDGGDQNVGLEHGRSIAPGARRLDGGAIDLAPWILGFDLRGMRHLASPPLERRGGCSPRGLWNDLEHRRANARLMPTEPQGYVDGHPQTAAS